jgi:hypothetical protein
MCILVCVCVCVSVEQLQGSGWIKGVAVSFLFVLLSKAYVCKGIKKKCFVDPPFRTPTARTQTSLSLLFPLLCTSATCLKEKDRKEKQS